MLVTSRKEYYFLKLRGIYCLDHFKTICILLPLRRTLYKVIGKHPNLKIKIYGILFFTEW